MLTFLYASYKSAVRFNELCEAADPIPPRTLAQRSRRGGGHRRAAGDRRPPAAYQLTAHGRRLRGVWTRAADLAEA